MYNMKINSILHIYDVLYTDKLEFLNFIYILQFWNVSAAFITKTFNPFAYFQKLSPRWKLSRQPFNGRERHHRQRPRATLQRRTQIVFI